MSLLCTLKNIHLAFGTKVLFEGANINIHTGDRIGLLGLNGRGKSSLFKILTEITNPDLSKPPFMFDKAKGINDPSKAFTVFQIPQDLLIPFLNRNYFFSKIILILVHQNNLFHFVKQFYFLFLVVVLQ